MSAWVIELTPKRAKNPIWPPTQHVLRGRIDVAKLPTALQRDYGQHLGQAVDRLTRECGGIVPGIRISIDLDTNVGVIFDPLEEDTPTNDEIFRTLAMIISIPKNVKPFRTITVELGRPELVATWLHWMKEFVNRGVATTVEGKEPSKKPTDIGRVKHNPFSTDPLEPKYLDEKDKTPLELFEQRAGKGKVG